MYRMRLFTAPDAVQDNQPNKFTNAKSVTQSTLNGVETVEMIAQTLDETTNGLTLSQVESAAGCGCMNLTMTGIRQTSKENYFALARDSVD